MGTQASGRGFLPLVTHPVYSYGFPEGHRFAMCKFRRVYEHLLGLGIAGEGNVFRPWAAKRGLIELVHDAGYVGDFIEGKMSEAALRRMGLPWGEELVKRTLISPAGTLLTAELALKHGVACHLAGGTHHAHFDFASGFCIFNDLAITAKALLDWGVVERVLIFDCDVHQGDGTARLLEAEPRVFTCSVHCGKNFPARKAESDLDVPIRVGEEDEGYLRLVFGALESLLDDFMPDLVLYDAGVDVYAGDDLGLLDISEAGIRARERGVLERCKEWGVPVATVIGGGYDEDRAALGRRHGICVEEAWAVIG